VDPALRASTSIAGPFGLVAIRRTGAATAGAVDLRPSSRDHHRCPCRLGPTWPPMSLRGIVDHPFSPIPLRPHPSNIGRLPYQGAGSSRDVARVDDQHVGPGVPSQANTARPFGSGDPAIAGACPRLRPPVPPAGADHASDALAAHQRRGARGEQQWQQSYARIGPWRYPSRAHSAPSVTHPALRSARRCWIHHEPVFPLNRPYKSFHDPS